MIFDILQEILQIISVFLMSMGVNFEPKIKGF